MDEPMDAMQTVGPQSLIVQGSWDRCAETIGDRRYVVPSAAAPSSRLASIGVLFVEPREQTRRVEPSAACHWSGYCSKSPKRNGAISLHWLINLLDCDWATSIAPANLKLGGASSIRLRSKLSQSSLPRCHANQRHLILRCCRALPDAVMGTWTTSTTSLARRWGNMPRDERRKPSPVVQCALARVPILAKG